MTLSAMKYLPRFPRLDLGTATESNPKIFGTETSPKSEDKTDPDALRGSDRFSSTLEPSTLSHRELTQLVQHETVHVASRNRSYDEVYSQEKQPKAKQEPYTDLGFLFSDGSSTKTPN